MSGAFIRTPAVVPVEKLAVLSPPTSASASVTSAQSLPSVNEEASGRDHSGGNKPSVHFGSNTNSDAATPPPVVGYRRRASVIGLNPDKRRASISPGSSTPGFNMRRRHSMWGSLTKRFTLPVGGTLREGSAEGRRTPAQLENTYKLKPSEDERLDISKVETEISTVLEEELEDVKYDPMEISIMSKEICDKIKNRVKNLGFCRHKLVAYVVMGSMLGQGMEITSRGMWDCNNDNYVSAKFQNSSIFAVAMVHGVYYE